MAKILEIQKDIDRKIKEDKIPGPILRRNVPLALALRSEIDFGVCKVCELFIIFPFCGESRLIL